MLYICYTYFHPDKTKKIRYNTLYNMKKAFFLIAFALSMPNVSDAQCDSTRWAREGTYEVYIVPGTVESSDVQPRILSGEERCLVESSRNLTTTVILRLDPYTEVRIYSLSQITEK